MTKQQILDAHDDLIDAVANYVSGGGAQDAIHLAGSDADLRASKAKCEQLTEPS